MFTDPLLGLEHLFCRGESEDLWGQADAMNAVPTAGFILAVNSFSSMRSERSSSCQDVPLRITSFVFFVSLRLPGSRAPARLSNQCGPRRKRALVCLRHA